MIIWCTGGAMAQTKRDVEVQKQSKKNTKDISKHKGKTNPWSKAPVFSGNQSKFSGKDKKKKKGKSNKDASKSKNPTNFKGAVSIWGFVPFFQGDITGDYSGTIKKSRSDRRKAQASGISYSGEFMPMATDFRSTKKYQRKDAKIKKPKPQPAKETSNFVGAYKIRTQKGQKRYFASISKEIQGYHGELKIKRSKKNMHPSIAYLEGKTKKSVEKKEKLRKRKIWWARNINKKGDQPRHLKDKIKKPKYDSRESKIWYD